MKQFYVVLAIILTCVCGLQVKAQEPKAEIKFDKSVYNFGKFTEDNSVLTCTFNFTNTGKAPLVITQCVASCGCTIPVYSDKPIAPGKTGTIKVTYNGKGRMAGQFKKIITVMTNATNKLTRLCIQGEMIEKKQFNIDHI